MRRPISYTLEDDSQPNRSTIYRLTGADVKRYTGKRVEIVGGVVTPRLKVSAGLRPSPNVAGQAGAIDPTQAVIAGSSGGAASGTGSADLPEFKVKSVKPVAGGCPTVASVLPGSGHLEPLSPLAASKRGNHPL